MAVMFFAGSDATNGTEPWRILSGGLPQQFADVSNGTGSSVSGGGGRFAEVNGRYYMTANPSGNASQIFDITDGAATPLTNFASNPTYSSGPSGVFAFNGLPYFIYYPPNGIDPPSLYAVNSGAPSLVGNLTNDLNRSVYPQGFTELGGRLYYAAWTGSNPFYPYELWSIGTSGDGTKLTGLPAGFVLPDTSNNFVKFGSAIYFVGDTPVAGSELYKISSAGAVSLVADINAGAGDSMTSYQMSTDRTRVFGGELYFTATGDTTGSELYKIQADGKVALVADINPGVASSGADLSRAVVMNGEMFFTATTAANGWEVWKVKADGTGILVADITGTSASSNPTNFMAFNNQLFFSATTTTHGRELWKIDGNGDPVRVTDIQSNAGDSNPRPIVVFNNALYFMATDAAHGSELWRVTAAGVVELVRDINPGSADGVFLYSQNDFKVFDGKLWFSAYDPDHGTELWSIDQTGNATLHDLNPGTGGGGPSNFTILGDTPNTAPTNITLSKTSVREFAATGTDVGILSAVDAQGGPFTYQLTNTAGGRFKITGNVLEVNNGLLSDFEQDSTHTVSVRVTDSGGLSFIRNFNLTLTDINPEVITGSSAADTFWGGALADVFNGGGGADTLKGYGGNDTLNGGTGLDSLIGGAGNDTFITDGGDVITEASGQGTDTVSSSATLTLGLNLENLTLTGSSVINGTGNTSANRIMGNGAANTLSGGGGVDSFAGGAGNDTFVTDGHDTITELSGQGTDLVKSSATITLGAYLENLTLTGSAAINGTGNTLANKIVGSSGANVLNGLTGSDHLTGGGGADSFVFSSALGSTNVDIITDFNVAADTIRLENAIFKGLAHGVLAASAFVSNNSGNAFDASDRIIYEKDTGHLYFDKDGSGSASKVVFADLASGLSVTSADFFVF